VIAANNSQPVLFSVSSCRLRPWPRRLKRESHDRGHRPLTRAALPLGVHDGQGGERTIAAGACRSDASERMAPPSTVTPKGAAADYLTVGERAERGKGAP
jgi:hypothetical protein